ncbi:MAG: single-stranded DNA-binding protein [Verrucomicrobia bacterium]|nr:MAG: single-stranded DNA-binding protein [Verrucomicrobiota bacterium]
MSQTPAEVLDTILGYLGFPCTIDEQYRDGHLVLQVLTHDADRLIGRRGEILEDLQFLVNCLLQARDRCAERVIVDVEHHRAMRDDAFIHKIKQLAEGVRRTGRPLQTDPLNSYDRRLVHNAFMDDPDLITSSPPEKNRFKRVSIRKKNSS